MAALLASKAHSCKLPKAFVCDCTYFFVLILKSLNADIKLLNLVPPKLNMLIINQSK